MPWRPDEAVVTNAYADDTRNVLPISIKDDGSMICGPFPGPSEVTDAANGRVLGAQGFVLPDGSVTTVVGTASKLYFVNTSTNMLDDVSGTAYSAAEGAPWDFEVYGFNLIATNVNDGPQRFIIGSDTAFSALAGSPSPGHLVSVWKDQLAIGGLGSDLEAVQWSEINDITDWTGGNSDTQVFPGFGRVTGISRGNTPVILQERGVQRGQFVGGTAAFEFDNLTEDFGCPLPGGAVFRRNAAFFWSEEGFKAITASGETQHIGFRKVDRWAADTINVSSDFSLQAFMDPFQPIVGWACQDPNEGTATYNTLLLYNIQLGEWTKVIVDTEYVLSWQPAGVTLEGLDVYGSLDAIPASLDSATWSAEAPRLGYASTAHKIGLFTGDNLAAEIYTGEFQGSETGLTRIRKVRPLIDAAATITHYGRDVRTSGWTAGSPEPTHPRTQEARLNRAARFHKLRVDVAAGQVWSRAAGLQEQSSAGPRA